MQVIDKKEEKKGLVADALLSEEKMPPTDRLAPQNPPATEMQQTSPAIDSKSQAEGCLLKAEEKSNGHNVHIKRNAKLSNRIFNFLNYFGIGFVANSALSLAITFNAMPTNTAQKGIHLLKKGLKPVSIGWDKAKGLVGMSKFSNMDPHIRDVQIGESARSMAEILCMCIAGTFLLFPMKWMEDKKNKIVDKIDRYVNRDYHRYCQQAGIEPEPIHEKEEEKQSWGKLITARAIGMLSVVGVDAGVQMFNNKRPDRWNMDTIEWKLGSWIYDKTPHSLRKCFVNFFDRKGGSIESIQPKVQKRLLETLNAPHDLIETAQKLADINENIRLNPALESAKNWGERSYIMDKLKAAAHPERAGLLSKINSNPEFKKLTKRAIFSEQTRFFSKEMSLTLLMAGLVYALSKSKIIFRGKDHQKTNILEAAATPIPMTLDTESSDRESSIVEPSSLKKSLNRKRPEALYTQKLASEAESASLSPRSV